jgi:hypothetical protein
MSSEPWEPKKRLRVDEPKNSPRKEKADDAATMDLCVKAEGGGTEGGGDDGVVDVAAKMEQQGAEELAESGKASEGGSLESGLAQAVDADLGAQQESQGAPTVDEGTWLPPAPQ